MTLLICVYSLMIDTANRYGTSRRAQKLGDVNAAVRRWLRWPAVNSCGWNRPATVPGYTTQVCPLGCRPLVRTDLATGMLDFSLCHGTAHKLRVRECR